MIYKNPERAFFHALLTSEDLQDELVSHLTPEIFTSKQAQKVCEVILDLLADGREISHYVVGMKLHENYPEAFKWLMADNESMSYIDARYYLQNLIDNSILSWIKSKLKEAFEIQDPHTVFEILSNIVTEVPELYKERVVRVYPLAEIVLQRLEQLKSNNGADFTLFSGFTKLDEKIGGFKPGELYVIAGRPGMGKTQFVLDLLYNVSSNVSTLLFTLEMTKETIGERYLAKLSGYPINYLKLGRFKEDEVYKTLRKLEEKKIWLIDDAFSFYNIANVARAYKRSKDIKLIAVDHLTTMNISQHKGESRENAVARTVQKFKQLALELKTPIILVSQLNRRVESRDKKRPELQDLRDSGRIEEYADVVLLLYRPGYYGIPSEYGDNEAEIIIAKNRNGQTGSIHLYFEPVTGFKNMDVVYNLSSQEKGYEF